MYIYIYMYVLTYPYVSNPEPCMGGGGLVLKLLANKISLVMGEPTLWRFFGDRCLEQLPTISL